MARAGSAELRWVVTSGSNAVSRKALCFSSMSSVHVGRGCDPRHQSSGASASCRATNRVPTGAAPGGRAEVNNGAIGHSSFPNGWPTTLAKYHGGSRRGVFASTDSVPSSAAARPEGILFCCPVCGLPLLPNGGERSLECTRGHNIAVAKEGHVNLLRTGRKARKGGKAGDEDGMVRARRAFFDKGHFSPVATAIASLVVEGIEASAPSPAAVAVLDAGCGEGTYIGEVHKRLMAQGSPATCFGVDISALAVRLAAKRHKDVSFAVGNCFSLPFEDSSFDCVVTAFSPWPPAEFKRVLKPGGFVVAAGPGPEHLNGLKAVLYGEPKNYQPRAFGSSTVGGAVDDSGEDSPPEAEAKHRVQAWLQVAGEDASNLLQMTPYWWKARPEQQDGISAIKVLETPLDVLLSRHRYAD